MRDVTLMTVDREPGSNEARDVRVPAPSTPLRMSLVYDLDGCRWPTGVTRHALAQLERLARRPDVALSLVAGRMTEPDGLAYWETLGALRRRELPVRMRHVLRWWRLASWPPVELWSGPVDWVYCPAEYGLVTRRARRAVTSHDAAWLQDVAAAPAMRARLARIFGAADLILSVSRFNTERLLEYYPECQDRVAYVPNAPEDFFFEPAETCERAAANGDLGLPAGVPYLLSVANFQPRKNLARLVRAAARLPQVGDGTLAVVLLGAGNDAEVAELREVIAAAGPRALIRMPGYRQGRALRAAYAGATALVFPSICESFGIPAVEAMAQGTPVALANSTALPEIGGAAGWYFDPSHDDSLEATLHALLDDSGERARRATLGRSVAANYRWQAANDLLVAELFRRR